MSHRVINIKLNIFFWFRNNLELCTIWFRRSFHCFACRVDGVYLSFDSSCPQLFIVWFVHWLLTGMSSSMLVAKFLSRLLGSPLLCLESRVVLLVRANLGWLWFAYCLLLYYTFMWCKFHTLDYRAGSFVWTSHFCLLCFPDLCFWYRMFMLVFYLPV